MTYRSIALLPAILLAGCATPAPYPLDVLSLDCTEFFAGLDRAARRDGVGDAEAARIEDFRYARVDRFLASFRNEVGDGRGFQAWLERLSALDRDARAVEIANARSAPDGTAAALVARVQQCGARLRQADMADPDKRARLRRNAVVPDEYRTAWRVLGLYPFSALFVSRGVRAWHRETHETFSRPLAALPVHGTLARYVPAATPVDDVSQLIARAPRDALGAPLLGDADLERLYARHAPVFEIDQTGDADHIGSPRWGNDGLPHVTIEDPTVYRRTSFARVGDRVLLQLNYIIWFPERPRRGAFDILAGRLDGVTWRVTLGPDGRSWLYDSMHNCGCYHMFFPVEPLRLRVDLDRGTEPPLVPQAAPILTDAMRIVIRFAHTTHYVERVYTTSAAVGARYRVDSVDGLRSLPYAGGRRSLYGPDGVVAGTERAERWFIWPMGIPAPGAMRQWGHHATAFVGRRHFDDPALLAQLFEGYPP